MHHYYYTIQYLLDLVSLPIRSLLQVLCLSCYDIKLCTEIFQFTSSTLELLYII